MKEVNGFCVEIVKNGNTKQDLITDAKELLENHGNCGFKSMSQEE